MLLLEFKNGNLYNFIYQLGLKLSIFYVINYINRVIFFYFYKYLSLSYFIKKCMFMLNYLFFSFSINFNGLQLECN